MATVCDAGTFTSSSAWVEAAVDGEVACSERAPRNTRTLSLAMVAGAIRFWPTHLEKSPDSKSSQNTAKEGHGTTMAMSEDWVARSAAPRSLAPPTSSVLRSTGVVHNCAG